VSQVAWGASLVGTWVRVEGRRVGVEQGRSVRSGSWWVVVDQVASVVEEASLGVGRTGSGAREELVLSGDGLLDEAGVGYYMATGSAVEVPEIRSSAYRDPSEVPPGLATLYELHVGMTDQH
jgi:hypothetical protein